MTKCPKCGTLTATSSRFCRSCGLDLWPYMNMNAGAGATAQAAPLWHSGAPSRGFGQIFGLDPRIAFLAFLVDLMLFSGTSASVVLTLGVTFPMVVAISIVAGIILGFISYKAQMKWYGDDQESAAIKGAIIGFLTAIPVGIPAFVWIPSGALGVIKYLRKS